MAFKRKTKIVLFFPVRLFWASAVLWVPVVMWWSVQWLSPAGTSDSSHWTLAGVLLQCIAVCLALYEAEVLRKKFGYESIWRLARKYLFPAWPRVHVVSAGIRAQSASLAMSGSVTTTNPTIEERVTALENQGTQMHKQFSEFKEQTTGHIAALKEDAIKKDNELNSRLNVRDKKSHDAHTSTFVHSIVGLIWILTGSVMQLAPVLFIG